MDLSTDVVQVIEERLREIDAQLTAYDQLARERDRLQRALHALRTDTGASAGGSRRQPGRTRTGRPAALGHAPGRRAQRGSNVAAIVDHVRANPGATAGQIAAATGIDRGVVYSATSRLASAGRLRRTARGGRQVGYELAAGDSPEPGAATGG